MEMVNLNGLMEYDGENREDYKGDAGVWSRLIILINIYNLIN